MWINRKIDNSQVPQEPALCRGCFLDLFEPGKNIDPPLLPFELLKLLFRLLLAVDTNYIIHIGYSPDVHVDNCSILQSFAQHFFATESIDDIVAYGNRICDNEVAFFEVGEQQKLKLVFVLL